MVIHLISVDVGAGACHAEARREIAHECDREALNNYAKEHRADLESEAKAIRTSAQRLEIDNDQMAIPLATQDWVQWLERHNDSFKSLLCAATERRRSLAQRLVPRQGGLPESDRIAPKRDSTLVPWMRKLQQRDAVLYLVDVQ